MRIVLPEYIDIFSQKHFDRIKKLGDVTIYYDFPKTDDEIIKRVSYADLIATKWLQINENILSKCSKLKYAIALSVGINFYAKKVAKDKGIKIINCPSYCTNSVAEHIFALMLALSRNIVKAQSSIRLGKWKRSPYSFMGTELSGKTIGLIGYGKIGKKVAQLSKCFGMNVLFVNSKSTSKQIDDLIKQSDFVSLNLTYNTQTHKLLDKKRLYLMKKTAFLINTSRGEIVDNKILMRLLKTDQIAGAGLDVFENEPINKAPSKEIINLARMPNVITTPHIGFNTKQAAERLGDELIENIIACVKGKPKNIANY